MPWILNEVNKPVFVQLGSLATLAADNCYVTECEAKAAQRRNCEHETVLGNRSTGHTFCADCGKDME